MGLRPALEYQARIPSVDQASDLVDYTMTFIPFSYQWTHLAQQVSVVVCSVHQ